MVRKTVSKSAFRFLTGLIALLSVTSCALPPNAAWRKIKNDGLFAYWSYELNAPRKANKPYPHIRYQSTPSTTPSYLTEQRAPVVAAKRSPQTTPTLPSQSVSKPVSTLATMPELPDRPETLSAIKITGLPGFVRSPYTYPPRLVDVSDAKPGSTMLCPFTHRPFIVPADIAQMPRPSAYADHREHSPPSAPWRDSSPFIADPIHVFTKPAPTQTLGSLTKDEDQNPAPPNTSDSPPVSVASTEPRPVQTTTPTPQVASSAPINPTPQAPVQQQPQAPEVPPTVALSSSEEIPYGIAIPGRRGVVNSPYAAKHQVVDVTGMPPGSKVQCPYTGKSFRVPNTAVKEIQTHEPLRNFASPTSLNP